MSYHSRRRSHPSRSSRFDYYGGFAPYVPVARRRAQALAALKKAAKNGQTFSPVKTEGRLIAKTFWGKAWCAHLESYSDFDNRLPRGRTYVRNGSVIDLQIGKGKITAHVSGSSIYQAGIDIDPLALGRWEAIKQQCAGRIDSLVDLLRGKLSDAVMRIITDRDHGLFPAPSEIHKTCSCPDWADLCKHLAAVLYGVGARFDTDPRLLFTLRGVNPDELLVAAAVGVSQIAAPPADAAPDDATLAAEDLGNVFGIEIDTTTATPPPARPADGEKKTPKTKPKPEVKPKPKAKAKTPAKVQKPKAREKIKGRQSGAGPAAKSRASRKPAAGSSDRASVAKARATPPPAHNH
jgi:uncharacterized Zn finger protein